jgi:hypothetical protein
MQARYYGGGIGRFLSPDGPFIDQEMLDPQSWNLYGYTGNNPLSRIDPDGRNWFRVNDTWQWHEGTDIDKNGDPCK